MLQGMWIFSFVYVTSWGINMGFLKVFQLLAPLYFSWNREPKYFQGLSLLPSLLLANSVICENIIWFLQQISACFGVSVSSSGQSYVLLHFAVILLQCGELFGACDRDSRGLHWSFNKFLSKSPNYWRSVLLECWLELLRWQSTVVVPAPAAHLGLGLRWEAQESHGLMAHVLKLTL